MLDLHIEVYAETQERIQDEIEFETDENREIELRQSMDLLENALSDPLVLQFIQDLTAKAIEVGRKLSV